VPRCQGSSDRSQGFRVQGSGFTPLETRNDFVCFVEQHYWLILDVLGPASVLERTHALRQVRGSGGHAGKHDGERGPCVDQVMSSRCDKKWKFETQSCV
jgi:hypothetical protein